MDSLRYNFKIFMPFSKEELKALAISVLAMTFIVAFNDGNKDFNLISWSGNFFVWLLIVLISIIIQQIGHRTLAILNNHKAEYQLWWPGIIIGIVVALVTNGKLWILIPGGIWMHHLPFHRIGKFRYGPNIYRFGLVALGGPLACIFFGTFIKTIDLWFPFLPLNSAIVQNIFFFNLAYAAFLMLPIPPLPGSRLLFASRLLYAFMFGSFAAYAILAYLGIFSFIFALIVGVLVWLGYYLTYEKGYWDEQKHPYWGK